MIYINLLTDKDIGRAVVYEDPGGKAPRQDGVITSWNKNFIFVRYKALAENGTATHAKDLHFLGPRPKLYNVHLKIYVETPGYEIPFYLPKECFIGGNVKTGYHDVDMFESEEEATEFERWVADHQGTMKIIGITPIEKKD